MAFLLSTADVVSFKEEFQILQVACVQYGKLIFMHTFHYRILVQYMKNSRASIKWHIPYKRDVNTVQGGKLKHK